MRLWIQTLNHELGGNALSLCKNVEKGFFLLQGMDRDVLNNALMLSPFKSKWGTCMIQSWIPGFDPENPSKLAFPTWVSLRNLPHEHQDQAIAIAESLGEVIGMDTANENAKDPRFCINLEISNGWATNIELETEGGILPPHIVLVDYDKLPIRCRVCLSWTHKASDCQETNRRPTRGKDRPGQIHHMHRQEKGKNIVVDEEGFQQVRSRKNTRRNVFAGALETRQIQTKPEVMPDSELEAGAAATAAAHLDKQEGRQSRSAEMATDIRTEDASNSRTEGIEGRFQSNTNKVVEQNIQVEDLDTDRPQQENSEDGNEVQIGKEREAQPGRVPRPGIRMESGTAVKEPADATHGGAIAADRQHIQTSGGREKANTLEEAEDVERQTGTSGEGTDEETQSGLETSMNWSPTKTIGQKRNIQAVEGGDEEEGVEETTIEAETDSE